MKSRQPEQLEMFERPTDHFALAFQICLFTILEKLIKLPEMLF